MPALLLHKRQIADAAFDALAAAGRGGEIRQHVVGVSIARGRSLRPGFLIGCLRRRRPGEDKRCEHGGGGKTKPERATLHTWPLQETGFRHQLRKITQEPRGRNRRAGERLFVQAVIFGDFSWRLAAARANTR